MYNNNQKTKLRDIEKKEEYKRSEKKENCTI